MIPVDGDRLISDGGLGAFDAGAEEIAVKRVLNVTDVAAVGISGSHAVLAGLDEPFLFLGLPAGPAETGLDLLAFRVEFGIAVRTDVDDLFAVVPAGDGKIRLLGKLQVHDRVRHRQNRAGIVRRKRIVQIARVAVGRNAVRPGVQTQRFRKIRQNQIAQLAGNPHGDRFRESGAGYGQQQKHRQAQAQRPERKQLIFKCHEQNPLSLPEFNRTSRLLLFYSIFVVSSITQVRHSFTEQITNRKKPHQNTLRPVRRTEPRQLTFL